MIKAVIVSVCVFICSGLGIQDNLHQYEALPAVVSNDVLRDSFTPNLDNLSELFLMTKNDVLAWLGANYEIVPTGAEGLYRGYFYEEYGITIAFGYEFYRPDVNFTPKDWQLVYVDKVMFIICDESPDILGAKLGMTFAEILNYLPDSEIRRFPPIIPPIEPEMPIYSLYFNYGEARVVFDAVPFLHGVEETVEIRMDVDKSVRLSIDRIFETMPHTSNSP
ncbi:MAG: hypothetical protein FWG87_13250 [Defluviitaleaceae bacterium]|nr:hypothetical protein [Defluviitaleaceae bacterium]